MEHRITYGRTYSGWRKREPQGYLTGATGMVGEGVLLECLHHQAISEVLMVNRRPYTGAAHPKLKELLVSDFTQLDSVVGSMAGYDACFFCAGISSSGLKEEQYRHITYDLTMKFARTLRSVSPNATFIYVSGAQTDSSEQGRFMWARVKGKTENDLLRIGFTRAYMFRPAFMKPTAGQKNVRWYYKVIGSLYPLLHLLVPNQVSTLREVAQAMIRVGVDGYSKPILEVKDINALASGT